ncbi:MAG: PAS domain S-box protein [Desulfomonilia bacterium]|jgi:PAS domain S-box-containing protein|nr:PAS domain S-box protein [Desulfomonilia bacterium]
MAGNATNQEVQKELHDLMALADRYRSVADQLYSRAVIVSRAPESVACIDRRYVYTCVNRAFLALYRKTVEEVLGHSIEEVFGEKAFEEREKPRIERALRGEEGQYDDLVGSPGDGRLPVLARYSPLAGKDGSIEGVVLSAWDMSAVRDAEEGALSARSDLDALIEEHAKKISNVLLALKREIKVREGIEAELRSGRDKLAKIFQSIPDPISISTLEEGIFLDANEAFFRMTGYSREEVIGNSSINLGIWYRPLDRARVVDLIRKQGSVRNQEAKLRGKSGESRVVLVSAELMDIDGMPSVLFESRDITERKTLESELSRSQKMEAIGRLAGGITHDFNNLLTAIDGYCELALLKLGNPEQVRSNILKIKEVKETASSLVRQLLAFSRKQKVKPRSLDMNQVIENMQNLLRQFIGEDIELKTRLEQDIGNVYADQGHVEQIIMNLALNARDAMHKGGVLTISTRRVYLEESDMAKHPDLNPGDYIKLDVSDTGVGMDEETMAHVFEPFFTTKEASKGTGLGLATIYGIVRNNGGSISLRSEPGKGSTFEVLLPVSGEVPEAVLRKTGKVPVRGGSEVVLVVEDNPYVLDLVTEVLGSIGYTLLKARSGKEAMDICGSHSGHIDLVIADVVLPGMDGPAIVKNLLKCYPRMKVLYITGYPGDMVSLYGIPDTEKHLLQKPFSAFALTEKVREVLEEDLDHE